MVAFAKYIKAVIEKEQLEFVILIGHSLAGGVITETAGTVDAIVAQLSEKFGASLRD
jgi:pimeloyl-ACP methyl ester carboxylesterase